MKIASVIRHLSWGALLSISFLVPFLISWQIFKIKLVVLASTFIISSLFLSILFFLKKKRRILDVLQNKLLTRNTNLLIFSILFTGLLVRFLYFELVSPWPIISDERSYLDLSFRLMETGSFFTPLPEYATIMWAFRPPGFPFALLPFIWLTGNEKDAVLILHSLSFIGEGILVFNIARYIFSRTTGVIAVFLIAIWPSSIFYFGLALSEPVSQFMVAGSIWTILRLVNSEREYLRWGILCGLFLGFTTLIKPSFLLIILIYLVYIFLIQKKIGIAIKKSALLLGAFMIVILPWSIRNYTIFEKVVLISTNGGSVFYRANNPLATGGFTFRGEKDLDLFIYDEVKRNEVGFQWGFEWIKQNPDRFLQLSLSKLRIFLGSDDAGSFYTYGRFLKKSVRPEYDDLSRQRSEIVGDSLELASNIWWIGLWALVASSLWLHRDLWIQRVDANFLTWPVLYLVGVHSVFESQPRYHMPIVTLLCIIAAEVVASRRQESHQDRK